MTAFSAPPSGTTSEHRITPTASGRLTRRGPVRIAQCIHGVGLGGAQQVIKTLVEAGDPEELHQVVYCSVDGVRRREIEQAGAEVFVMPRRLPKFDPFWMRALATRMEADRIDLVHTHLFGDSLHGLLAARRRGLPVVMTLHNVAEAHSALQRTGYRWLIARSAAAVACSDHAQASWLRFLRTDEQVVGSIPNGLATPADSVSPGQARERLRDELGIPEEAFLIAAIGRLVEQKAYHVLLEAVAGLEPTVRSSCRLLFLGDGPLRESLGSIAAKLGLASLTTFAGVRTDVPELLAGVDVVAFSSSFEGLPIALLEAMAASRPVVATAVGGIPEAVRHDRDALLVEAGDSVALSAAIGRLATEPELRSRLGEAALERFSHRYTSDVMAAEYRNLYRRVLERGANARATLPSGA